MGRQLSSTPNTTPTTLIPCWSIDFGLLLLTTSVMKKNPSKPQMQASKQAVMSNCFTSTTCSSEISMLLRKSGKP